MKTTIEQLLNKTLSLGAALLITAGTSAFADTNWYISTDQTGAQTQIDSNHLSSWILTPPNDVHIWGGNFVLKDGPKTDEIITFSLYLGALKQADLFSGTNIAFRWVVLSNTDFKQQNPTDQQYNSVIFQFADAPLTLSNSITYTATLTSQAADEGDGQYFIKGGSLVIAGVPEPASWFLLGLGLLILLIAYRRRTGAECRNNGIVPCLALAGLTAFAPLKADDFPAGHRDDPLPSLVLALPATHHDTGSSSEADSAEMQRGITGKVSAGALLGIGILGVLAMRRHGRKSHETSGVGEKGSSPTGTTRHRKRKYRVMHCWM